MDKFYAGLKDLAQERRSKLEEVFKLYTLHREIDDLLEWIAEKSVVAGSNEPGQDYEHVSVRLILISTHVTRVQSSAVDDLLHSLYSFHYV